MFILAGSSLVWLWAGIVLMGLFSFAESPQLQALLADIAPPATRDASYALYFTLAFGVGSLWTALYGIVIEGAGRADRRPGRLRADGGRVRGRGRGHPADPDRRRGHDDTGWHTAAERALTDGPHEEWLGREDPARRG